MKKAQNNDADYSFIIYKTIMMKNRLFILILLSGALANAQEEITKTKLAEINREVAQETTKYKDSLTKAGGAYVDPLDIEFKTDIFKIEQTAKKKIDIDYTTAGITTYVMELNKDYDKLLNKYYTILLKKLSTKDQEKLKETQRNWLKFRDSEIQLIDVVSKDEYSGGGTIQSNIQASRIKELTEARLIDIKNHLNQFMD